ncbi:galactose oxidase early set domain-containing protein [Candidatus Pelagibacter sp.]|nr:galactose oxidase early set domain-containing protein [Candidatus Pelagibacter sp.]
MNSKILKLIFILGLLISIFVIFVNSSIDLYLKKSLILSKLGISLHGNDYHNERRFLINPLKQSERQIPPLDIKDLKINNNSNVVGQWSAPIDWNVTAIHSILLPDETVMTFGSYGIDKKENDKDIRSNKKITITDGRELDRDGGSHQWEGHDVNSGIDFDIWDPKKGVDENSHILFKQPVVMDAFCSVVRVLDNNRIFIVGGNKNHDSNLPDSQNQTMIYDVLNKKFSLSKNLNFKRWYGSVVITGDEKMFMFGGMDTSYGGSFSTTPEMIDLKNIDQGWIVLEQADSNDLFGNKDAREWSYPRTFLASDGNIVGISYNKTWVMDVNNNYRVMKTGEIPLEKSGISKILEHSNPNFDDNKKERLKLLTIGSAVGDTNSVVMIAKDKVLVFGGKQNGEEYSPSNKVFLIDFSDSFKPLIKELKSMNFARSNGNATIMPDGNIFLNGGHSFKDLEFSVFTPEIYNSNTQTTKEMSNSYFRRNYHSSSLLLTDGRILTAGGDVWNAEIFYPPYLFTKNSNDKTVLAKRPQIMNLDNNIKRGEKVEIEVNGEISKVSLISTGSTTHAQGSESKFRNINFTKVSNDKIEIKLDNNSNNLQNGTYLLFVLNSKGTPSEGKIVFIN